MSWGRINHPSEILKIDQELEVKVLSIDKDKEKIALGLKQKDASPWEKIEEKYPIGSVHEATVVNIMSYGAFCKLEEGVEGLVHISEMSWTKRINHPSEVVTAEQKVKVKVLEINKDKQEISLGMKQVEENPWERVAEKYPPGSVVTGKVRNIANYGAFVRSKKASTACCTSAISRGRRRSAILRSAQEGRGRTGGCPERRSGKAAHRAGPEANAGRPVADGHPDQLPPRHGGQGSCDKIANFGVFVELEPGLEGLLHISEISDQKVEKPEDLLKVNQEVDVKILRVDSDEAEDRPLPQACPVGAGKRRSARRCVRSVPRSAGSAVVWKAARVPRASRPQAAGRRRIRLIMF